ncbi:MAG: hypothetical protein MZV63_63460 [Marinilabiliales bacterium]|nr:hypothetical protein [Marinilabiliales bacterium]
MAKQFSTPSRSSRASIPDVLSYYRKLYEPTAYRIFTDQEMKDAEVSCPAAKPHQTIDAIGSALARKFPLAFRHMSAEHAVLCRAGQGRQLEVVRGESGESACIGRREGCDRSEGKAPIHRKPP